MILVIQNSSLGPPGILSEVMTKAEQAFAVVYPYVEYPPELPARMDALIVLGGEMSVTETDTYPFLTWVKSFIREVVNRQTPVLGICLGGQILADAVGGKVSVGARGEKGCHSVELTRAGMDDPLFHGLPKRFVTFQWHQDSFEFPPEAVHLASSGQCPFQAQRWGKNAYGIQFHPEIDPAILKTWIDAEGDSDQLLRDFQAIDSDYRITAEILFDNFLRIVHSI